MSRLSIIYVAPFDLSQPAGHVSHVLATVRQLVQKGHNVTLIAIDCPDEVEETVRVRRIRTINRRFLRSISFGVGSMLAIVREKILRRPDVVYTRYFASVFLSLMSARSIRIPVVVEINADLANERQLSNLGDFSVLAGRFENWATIRFASTIVAVTAAIKESAARIVPGRAERFYVVENGVDTNVYTPKNRSKCAALNQLKVNRKRIIFTGSFQIWQGVLDLLVAMSHIVQKRRDVDLILVGDGPLNAQIQHKIEDLRLEDNVWTTGLVSEETAASLICASDICVAPYNKHAASDTEIEKSGYGALLRGSPLKIYSYLACGRPVVASHFLEAGVYVATEGAGLAVAPERPAELASALEHLLANPSLARSMGARGREIVVERHDWSSVVDNYVEIVRLAIGKK